MDHRNTFGSLVHIFGIFYYLKTKPKFPAFFSSAGFFYCAVVQDAVNASYARLILSVCDVRYLGRVSWVTFKVITWVFSLQLLA